MNLNEKIKKGKTGFCVVNSSLMYGNIFILFREKDCYIFGGYTIRLSLPEPSKIKSDHNCQVN